MECEACAYYEYDEEEDAYYCSVNLDEDDMVRFLSSQTFNCPFYCLDDEYRVVRRQI